jgi:hypothetical protein
MARKALWPTPKSSPSGPDFARVGREGSGGDDLATAVAKTEMLPTPIDPSKGGGSSRSGNRIGETPSLHGMARKGMLEKWPIPTPTAGDAKASGSRNLEGSKAHAGVSLTDYVKFGNSRTPRTVPTPSANDYKIASKDGQRRGQLGDPAMKVIEPGGALNPGFVEWLMGFPRGWTET